MARPRDLRHVADVVLDTRSGEAVRLEYWDNHGAPLGGKGRIRRMLDLHFANRGDR